MSDVTCFRINNANNSSSILRGIVTWFPEHYTVKILEESAAYEGEVTVDIMSECCQSLKLSVEEYINECKIAFKTSSESRLYFFSIEDGRLNIRKLYEVESGSTFKFIFSSVILKKIDFSSVVFEVLDTVLQLNINHSQTIDTLYQKVGSLLADYDKVVLRAEEMEKDKLMFENIIYHKFVNLLNSKKDFYKKHGTPKVKEESEEFRIPCVRNVNQEVIFDAETDSDEADVMSSRHENESKEPSTSTIHNVPSEEFPRSSSFESNSTSSCHENQSSTSTIHNIPSKESPNSYFENNSTSTCHENQPSTSTVHNVPCEKSPGSPYFKSTSNHRSSSSLENKLNTLLFLDPSVPFLKK